MEQGLLGDLSEDLLDAILTEAGRFAEEGNRPLAISVTSRARATSMAA